MSKRIQAIVCILTLAAVFVFAAETAKHSFKPRGGYVPDAKTAIRIAVAVWEPIMKGSVNSNIVLTACLRFGKGFLVLTTPPMHRHSRRAVFTLSGEVVAQGPVASERRRGLLLTPAKAFAFAYDAMGNPKGNIVNPSCDAAHRIGQAFQPATTAPGETRDAIQRVLNRQRPAGRCDCDGVGQIFRACFPQAGRIGDRRTAKAE